MSDIKLTFVDELIAYKPVFKFKCAIEVVFFTWMQEAVI